MYLDVIHGCIHILRQMLITDYRQRKVAIGTYCMPELGSTAGGAKVQWVRAAGPFSHRIM